MSDTETTPAQTITRDEVAHLARLARIALSEEELDHLGGQIDQIVGYVQQIRAVDTTGVEPMSHPTQAAGVMREDRVGTQLTAEQALDQAPEAADDRFVVPQILTD